MNDELPGCGKPSVRRKLIARITDDGFTAEIIDADSGERKFELVHEGDAPNSRWRIWDVALSPDDRLIATGSRDTTARLWDAATGHLLLVIRKHNGYVWSVAFSPDNKLLATAGSDGLVRLCDLPTAHERAVFEYGPSGMFQNPPGIVVHFSDDGRQVKATYTGMPEKHWVIS